MLSSVLICVYFLPFLVYGVSEEEGDCLMTKMVDFRAAKPAWEAQPVSLRREVVLTSSTGCEVTGFALGATGSY